MIFHDVCKYKSFDCNLNELNIKVNQKDRIYNIRLKKGSYYIVDRNKQVFPKTTSKRKHHRLYFRDVKPGIVVLRESHKHIQHLSGSWKNFLEEKRTYTFRLNPSRWSIKNSFSFSRDYKIRNELFTMLLVCQRYNVHLYKDIIELIGNYICYD